VSVLIFVVAAYSGGFLKVGLSDGIQRGVGCVVGTTNVTHVVPSGKHTKNHGKSPCFMGKTTISMAVFNSYVKLPEGITLHFMGI